MRDLSSSLCFRAGKLALSCLLLASSHILPSASAFSFTSIPSPNLNLDGLGRVAFAGNFDSISLYQFEGQSEKSAGSNGALLSRFPNGVFAPLNNTDADIKAMCAFQANGTLQGIVFGGNFTSVGETHTPGGIAWLNVTSGQVYPLTGLNGTVNALFCDPDAGRVYIGGSFTGGGASNAIVWTTQWTNMPFSGFNGPVNSITKLNGNIIFGGKFNGLGNSTAPKENNTQVIPIGSASISAQTSSGTPGFTDPSSIVCKTGTTDGTSNNTWLLADNTPGFWKAEFAFGFEPSKLRLYNTKFEGRGTREWRFTALPDGGIMNFSYIDPTSGTQKFCDARCPLPENNVTAQDFHFVNTVGMNSFRLDISGFYGKGGGLSGIELFQNEIFSFAISNFNEPACDGVSVGAKSTATGPWQTTPSHQSNANYLSAVLQGNPVNQSAAQVIFTPDIRQSGNYSVTVFTPGCVGDGTCGNRGRVNITGTYSQTTSSADGPRTTELFQTNNFDKYDEVYRGFVDSTDSFRPSVTLTPMAGQTGPITIVAQRVRFELLTAASGNLNGIFEYDPSKQDVNINFRESVIDSAGASLTPRDQAIVNSVVTDNSSLFVGGNFSGNGLNNIFSIQKDATKATGLPENGLDSEVLTMFLNGTTMYVGGNFTKTQDNKTPGLQGIAAFSTSDNKWQALGAGVNGVVMYIVPFPLNITGNRPETVLGISGVFSQVNQFGSNASFAAQNFAIWVPSRSNWLHNLNVGTISIEGALTAFTEVPGSDPLFGGSINSQALGASGAVALESGNPLSLEQFPVAIQPQQSSQGSLQKRATTNGQNQTGVIAATFYKGTNNNMNKTILAGHFKATDSDGKNITSLLIIDGKDSNKITGLHEEISSDSTFLSLAVVNNILFAGGAISGTVNNKGIGGLLAFDLSSNNYVSTQPPSLRGTNVTVNTIAARPKSRDVFVGGNFNSAGDLSCQALCIWNTDRNQWVSPGGDLGGSISSMAWVTDTKLLVAGNLTSGNNQTKILMYDSSKSTFQEYDGARDLPGPVTAICPATSDATEIWATGQASNGSAFLQRFGNDKKWHPVPNLFGSGTTIRGIQVLSLDKQHGKSDVIDQGQDLLILGQVNITNFGTASGVLFNGTTLQPFLLSTTSQNTPGSLSQVFVENPQSFFKQQKKHLLVIYVVLISLAIALAITFLLIVAGILIESYRKRSKGYTPMQMSYPDRSVNVSRVPPSELFATLRGNRTPAI
ncbi:uncharacterized protein BDR25DRAFT_99126 [Lindgomyces ingoldianus]|uniref:Uncharacterized protein n=1 Tax=Lindgomyces ingoldianus TaxID=673940 RepID=A0ACB6QD55_9PLEO|nr:uncharacterized protein BDR25DRAFT_99126 [Lindgomyces ingoldianus]KAF2464047.1 hypothetical protein BDR25DRAFT_99126 [Lindgomyces ingoldianus]